MQAVIIAAGRGVRLRPLTEKIPKCMAGVKGRPMLEHILEKLSRAGISESHLVVGYKREIIEDHFGPEFGGIKLNYFVQKEAKGTAHALSLVEGYTKGKFLLTNSDVLTETLNYKMLAAEEGTRDADAIIMAREVHDPWRFGVLKTSKERVVDIIEKPLPGDEPGKLVNAGIYSFGKDFFAAVRETPLSVRGEYELVDSIRNYMGSKKVVEYRLIEGTCIDIEHMHDLEAADEMDEEEFPH